MAMRCSLISLARRSSLAVPSTVMHVSRISWITYREQLMEYFSKFGKIEKIVIPIDTTRGVHRGYCFIHFADKESMTKALSPGYPHFIDGKELRVKIAHLRNAEAL
ncbi:hypothetical protein AB6A40_003650 [Gnathostoma spinigerum]|uniref:RRM domain-containing protein n=1 Tax=Gnathostoma spinigerum TaxID=75299 RepID=A0ABD6EBC2_9BILA